MVLEIKVKQILLNQLLLHFRINHIVDFNVLFSVIWIKAFIDAEIEVMKNRIHEKISPLLRSSECKKQNILFFKNHVSGVIWFRIPLWEIKIFFIYIQLFSEFIVTQFRSFCFDVTSSSEISINYTLLMNCVNFIFFYCWNYFILMRFYMILQIILVN